MEKCLEMIDAAGIKRVQIKIHENVTLIHPDGTQTQAPIAFETPFIEGIEDLRIKYKDIFNPETGPQTIRELAEIVRIADKLFHDKENPRGLDPYGGEILTDVLKGLAPGLILKLSESMPQVIGTAIRSRVKGVEGQIRNFIRQSPEEELMLIDPGMHDFSEKGKYTWITKPIHHHLMFASLIEMLKCANRQMPEDRQIPQEELENLPFNGSEIHRRIAKAMMALMFPVFERFDEHKAEKREESRNPDPTPPTPTKILRFIRNRIPKTPSLPRLGLAQHIA